MATETLEVPLSGREVIRVEGVQRDRRRRNDLKITMPDGRVFLAHGRRVKEPGWEVYPEDESDAVGGDTLGGSLVYLLGFGDHGEGGPEWLDRLV